MAALSDLEIIELAHTKQMISPFVQENVRYSNNEERVISYGVSSYGYDARACDEFKVFTNVNNGIIDPKNFTDENFVDKKGDFCIIPPNSFALGSTIEYFKIPDDLIVVCLGKSTYARCGLIVNVTPIEPGFEGNVTLEFSNTTTLPMKIYANEGICQFIFFKGKTKCKTTYKDKNGKYQGQKGITIPRL